MGDEGSATPSMHLRRDFSKKSTSSKNQQKNQQLNSTALRTTRRGAGAHGPPRVSGESLWGTLVPMGDLGTEESNDSPTKGTAPKSANTDNVRKRNEYPKAFVPTLSPLFILTKIGTRDKPYINQHKLPYNIPNTKHSRRGHPATKEMCKSGFQGRHGEAVGRRPPSRDSILKRGLRQSGNNKGPERVQEVSRDRSRMVPFSQIAPKHNKTTVLRALIPWREELPKSGNFLNPRFSGLLSFPEKNGPLSC